MRVLVFPASLGLGGSQFNAVEIARAIGERGHEVTIFGPDGALRQVIDAAGLPFVAAPPRPKVRPSPSVMRRLTATVRRLDIDIVHGYEWPPILEAAYGPYVRHGTAVVGTVMSMGVAPFIPSCLPLAVGTAQIADVERARRNDVTLLEPPVDTALNRPWPDVSTARQQVGVRLDEFLLVVVSRLANELKREGLLDAIRAVGLLADELPVRLVIVGDGPARQALCDAADAVNRCHHRQVVTMTGEMGDPRPAYAAADVAIGMGSSALRAMAFAKPLIVQGEQGFWKVLTPETVATFLHQGWYGIGPGDDGAVRLGPIIRALHADASRRAELGSFSRGVVVQRFSLDRAADLQEEIYHRALHRTRPRRTTVPSFALPLARVGAYELARRYARWRGTAATDDFNALRMQPGATQIREAVA
jgi:glycosyltransferase involved in cell wall biosynthesis